MILRDGMFFSFTHKIYALLIVSKPLKAMLEVVVDEQNKRTYNCASLAVGTKVKGLR